MRGFTTKPAENFCVCIVLVVCLLLLPQLVEGAVVDSTWLGGAGDWSDSGMWNPAVAPDNGADTYNVFIDGGLGTASAVNLDISVWVDTLSISHNDSLGVNNSKSLGIAAGSLPNSGTLSINSAGSYTYLYIPDTVTLDGGGTISLSNHANNRIRDNSGGNGHFINEDNLIQGAGRIGDNYTQLTNRGTYLANLSNSLKLNPNDMGMVNSGILRASDGGTLELEGGDFTNYEGGDNGLIEARNGSLVLLDTVSIYGGEMKTIGDGIIESAGGNVTIDHLDLQGTLRIANSHNTFLTGTVQNNSGSTIDVDSQGSYTYLYVPEETIFTGGGSVVLSDHANNRIQDNALADGHLINEDNTIRGGGRLGVGTLQITNRGLILADSSHSLILDPNVNGMVNKGVLRASDGATMELAEGTYTNYEGGTDGIIEAMNGSGVALNGATIEGGLLKTNGDGVIYAENGTNTLIDPELMGHYRIDNSENTFFRGTVLNHPGSTISVESTGSYTYLYIPETTMLTGGGTVSLSDHSNNRVSDNFSADGHLINQDNVIHGAGWIGAGTLQITNRSLIVADHPASALEIDPNSQGVINTGTLQAKDGASLQLKSGAFVNHEGGVDGTIEAMNTSTVELSSVSIEGGLLRSHGSGIIRAVGGTVSIEDVSIAGRYQVDNSEMTNFLGTIDNQLGSTIIVNATGAYTYFNVPGETILTGGGSVVLTDDSRNRVRDDSGSNGHLINLNNTIRGAGDIGLNTLQITNSGQIWADGTVPLVIDPNGQGFENLGILTASGTGGMEIYDSTGTLFVTSGNVRIYENSVLEVTRQNGVYRQMGGVTRVDGWLGAGDSISIEGGLLMGSGTLGGEVSIMNDSIVAPGGSPGVLHIEGGYEQGLLSTLEIEINGYIQGNEYDLLDISNTAILAGELSLILDSAFAPSLLIGDMFTIVETGGGITGMFSSVDVNYDGYEFVQVISGNDLILEVIAVPEPSLLVLMLLGGSFVLLRRR